MAMYSVVTPMATVTAAATKSAWLLNPVTVPIVIAQLSVSFGAAAPFDAVDMELYRVTTIGSAAGTAFTPRKVNRIGDVQATIGTTALAPVTTEPTAVEVLAAWCVQPFGGCLDIQYPLGREPIAASAGQRLGLRYIAPATITSDYCSYVWFDEM